MDNIIYHQNQMSLNSFPSHLKAGTINQLNRKSYTQLININTRFRNNYTTTPASNFGFMMPAPIKKVVSMKVVCVNLPSVVYTVSAGSNSFFIGKTNPTTLITIPNGSYTGLDMATQITGTLSLMNDLSNISLKYNLINGKMTFDGSGSQFSLNFSYVDPSGCPNTFYQTNSNIYKDQLTIGWLLGFRQNYQYSTPLNAVSQTITYPISNSQIKTLSKINNRRPTLSQVKQNGAQYLEPQYNCCVESTYQSGGDISFNYANASSYIGEAVYEPLSSRYFLLSVNDFQNNHTIAVLSPLQEETLGNGSILAKIPVGCCATGCSDHIPRIYFGPTDISKLHITLYDEFVLIVNINNDDYSFTLEIEVLYDL